MNNLSRGGFLTRSKRSGSSKVGKRRTAALHKKRGHKKTQKRGSFTLWGGSKEHKEKAKKTITRFVKKYKEKIKEAKEANAAKIITYGFKKYKANKKLKDEKENPHSQLQPGNHSRYNATSDDAPVHVFHQMFLDNKKLIKLANAAKSNRLAQHSAMSSNAATTQQVAYSTLSDREAIENEIIRSLLDGENTEDTIKDLKQQYIDEELNPNDEGDTIDDFYNIVSNKFKTVERHLGEKFQETPREDIYFMVKNLTKHI
jgi:hypothetical protein